MKKIPFNAELAKKGFKVQTKDGRDVRILCYDRKCTTYPIVALVPDDNGTYENNLVFTADGRFTKNTTSELLDLVILIPTKEVYINLYRDAKNKKFYLGKNVYNIKVEAEYHGKLDPNNYVKTITVDIEFYDD